MVTLLIRPVTNYEEFVNLRISVKRGECRHYSY